MALFYPATVIAEPTEEPVVVLPSKASLIADAILVIEGRCGAGQSGESGCFQYLPGTWKAYSMDVVGEVLPHTEANERYVTEQMIQKWLDEGVTERGIFLTWNQGSPTGWGPGTKDCYAGINKWGVAYDSCDYAARGLRTLESLSSTTPNP